MSTIRRFSTSALVVCCMLGISAFGQEYTQTNLVSNTSGVAPVTDPSLVNAWGISRGSGSPWWVSDNLTGLSTLYTGNGTKESLVVKIPAAKAGQTGSPTGTIFNGSTTDFLLAPGAPAIFLFATIDGTIAGWNPAVGLASGMKPPSTNAVTVVRTKDQSVFTGLTAAYCDGKRYLYAANFNKGRVDVYDNTFHRVWEGEEHFEDDQLPDDYVPFNVQTIGNDIVVTYVLHQEGQPLETDGPGLGYVDIYSSSGKLLVQLEHGEWLNAPWGVALAPLDFGRFSHDLLIAQFAGGGNSESSGYIAAYDLATGRFVGLLQDTTGKPLAINGVWAISPGNVSPTNADAAGAPSAELYFSAGPNHGAGGLFGYLTAVPTDLVQGNSQ